MRHLLTLIVILALLTYNTFNPVGIRNSSDSVFSPSHSSVTIAANVPSVTLTYTSLWNSTETPVNPGDKIAGDHITLHARWTPAELVNKSRIEVNATVIPKVIFRENQSAEVSIDTRELANNFTCLINMTAWLTNGSIISTIIEDVFLGNFFTPNVQVLTPNGGEVWTGVNNITWNAWDLNVGETLTFDVLISSDGGISFQLIASQLNTTWYEWDCSGFTKLSTYVVEVRAFDGIYSSFDRSDGMFTAGEIPPPVTTTPTPPPEQSPFIMFFLISVVVTSGLLALMVYLFAKRWL